MARSLEFDYDKAIDKATRVFWKQGYPGTSLRDLLKAIGIGEGSFYNTLKGKKQLFLKCLKRYEETASQRHAGALLSPTSRRRVCARFLIPCSTISTIPGPRAFASWREACPQRCWGTETYKKLSGRA